MGAQIDTGGDKRSVDVAVNIVPFIDLMSCLVAFLMFTAQWLQTSRIETSPRGRTEHVVNAPDQPMLSMLVTDERVYLGATRVAADDATRVVERQGRPPDAVWAEVDADLRAMHGAYFSDRTDIEIAAESRDQHVVPYQDLVAAMDHAIRAGFSDVALTDPGGLSARPRW